MGWHLEKQIIMMSFKVNSNSRRANSLYIKSTTFTSKPGGKHNRSPEMSLHHSQHGFKTSCTLNTISIKLNMLNLEKK